VIEMQLWTNRSGFRRLWKALRSECARNRPDDAFVHAALVCSVIREVVLRCRHRHEPVLVVVSCHADCTAVMLRDPADREVDLDRRRARVLDQDALSWSTMSGPEGRTLMIDVERFSRRREQSASAG